MREAFCAYDFRLITKVFEPVVWRIERMTGVNQFMQARYLLTILLAADATAYFMVPIRAGKPPEKFGLLMMFVMMFAALQRSRMSEQRARTNGHNDQETYVYWDRALSWAATVYIGLSMALLSDWSDYVVWTQNILFHTGFLSYICFLYVIACRMPPPRSHDIRVDETAKSGA